MNNYITSWECPSIQQCVFVCSSVSQTVCPRPIWSILGPQFTTYYTKWKFFSSSGTLLPHTGSYTVCYVICVTHWIHTGWSMSPRTSLESTKSIISLNRLSFDAAEFWCIISLKVINILLNLSFWQILWQMFTRYTVMFMYMDLSHINFEYLCKIIILL